MRPHERAWRTPLLALAAAVILLLALYTIRSTVMLNYYRADGSARAAGAANLDPGGVGFRQPDHERLARSGGERGFA